MTKALMPAFRADVFIDQMAEARAHDDGHIRADGENLLCKFDTRHLGHGLVGNDEVEAGGVLLQERQGILAASTAYHLVAQFRQKFLPHFHQGLLVIDKEDSFGAGGDVLVCGRVSSKALLQSSGNRR